MSPPRRLHATRPTDPAEADELDALQMRIDVRFRLRQFGVTQLADFARLRASDLRTVHGLGYASVQRIRVALANRGLALQPEPMTPEQRALHDARRLRGAAAPRVVTPRSSIGTLGLSSLAVRRLLDRGLATVGELAQLTPAELAGEFSRTVARRVHARLTAGGIALRGDTTPLGLWRAGLIDADECPWPAADAPLTHLLPWLGHAVISALSRAGLTRAGECFDADAATLASVAGMTASGTTRVRQVVAARGSARTRTTAVPRAAHAPAKRSAPGHGARAESIEADPLSNWPARRRPARSRQGRDG